MPAQTRVLPFFHQYDRLCSSCGLAQRCGTWFERVVKVLSGSRIAILLTPTCHTALGPTATEPGHAHAVLSTTPASAYVNADRHVDAGTGRAILVRTASPAASLGELHKISCGVAGRCVRGGSCE